MLRKLFEKLGATYVKLGQVRTALSALTAAAGREVASRQQQLATVADGGKLQGRAIERIVRHPAAVQGVFAVAATDRVICMPTGF